MTDQEVLMTHNDIEMFQRPHLWPHKVRLPLERNLGDGQELGFMIPNNGPTVYLDVFICDPGTCHKVGYHSYLELFEDGWRVD